MLTKTKRLDNNDSKDVEKHIDNNVSKKLCQQRNKTQKLKAKNKNNSITEPLLDPNCVNSRISENIIKKMLPGYLRYSEAEILSYEIDSTFSNKRTEEIKKDLFNKLSGSIN